jgi:hypothetical protein
MAGQCSGFVAVVLLVGLAAQQQGQQAIWPAKLLDVLNLLLVVVVHKGLDGGDGAVHGPPP